MFVLQKKIKNMSQSSQEVVELNLFTSEQRDTKTTEEPAASVTPLKKEKNDIFKDINREKTGQSRILQALYQDTSCGIKSRFVRALRIIKDVFICKCKMSIVYF